MPNGSNGKAYNDFRKANMAKKTVAAVPFLACAFWRQGKRQERCIRLPERYVHRIRVWLNASCIMRPPVLHLALCGRFLRGYQLARVR